MRYFTSLNGTHSRGRKRCNGEQWVDVRQVPLKHRQQNSANHIGGDTLRVRVSNAYGNGRLEIGAAYVGLRDQGPAIVPGSERPLTFGGSGSATVSAGAHTLDRLPLLTAKALQSEGA